MTVDFGSADFFRGKELIEDPYPYYEWLRDQNAVTPDGHHGVLMVTGYDEAMEVLQDPDRFSSCISVTGPFPGFPVPLTGDDVNEQIDAHRTELPFFDQLPAMDPPVHSAHRGLLMKLLTPKRLKENEGVIGALADRMLDEFLPAGKGDLIADFAAPYTLLVIGDLLGVPDEEQQRFLATLRRNPNANAGVGGTDQELPKSPLEFLYARFMPWIEDRRANPRDDVLTGMATATFPDGSLPEASDVVKVAANVFSAGQETTVRLLSASVKILADRPDLQDELRADPSKIPNFVEEALRWDGPIKGDFRMARTTTALGGVEVPAGTILMLVNGAANRDPRRFEDPAEFRFDRSNARHHMAFGRGIHTCPGAPLARAEGRVALERLLARATDIRISEAAHGPEGGQRFQYVPTYILRGLVSLNIEFTPVKEG